jgi:hypothetical protein
MNNQSSAQCKMKDAASDGAQGFSISLYASIFAYLKSFLPTNVYLLNLVKIF